MEENEGLQEMMWKWQSTWCKETLEKLYYRSLDGMRRVSNVYKKNRVNKTDTNLKMKVKES